jgi:hypothetical protein
MQLRRRRRFPRRRPMILSPAVLTLALTDEKLRRLFREPYYGVLVRESGLHANLCL